MEYVYATRVFFSRSDVPVVVCGIVAIYALTSILEHIVTVTSSSDERKSARKDAAITVAVFVITTAPFAYTLFAYASSINRAAEVTDQINAVNNVEKPGRDSFFPLPKGSNVEKCSVNLDHPMTYMWVGEQFTYSVPTEEADQRVSSKVDQCSLKVVEDIPEDTYTTFKPTENNFFSGENKAQSQALKDAVQKLHPDQFVAANKEGTSARVTDINGHQIKQYIVIIRDSESSRDYQTIHIFDKTKIN